MSGAPKLVALSPQFRGTNVELDKEQILYVGRSEQADLTFDDPTVSGRHCQFSFDEEGQCILRDLGSTNGTRVNADQLDADVDVILSPGDLIMIGGVEVLFEAAPPEGSLTSSGTQTVIKLQDTDSREVASMRNIGKEIGGGKRRNDRLREDDGKSKLVFWGILGGLGLMAVIALMLFVVKVVFPS